MCSTLCCSSYFVVIFHMNMLFYLNNNYLCKVVIIGNYVKDIGLTQPACIWLFVVVVVVVVFTFW